MEHVAFFHPLFAGFSTVRQFILGWGLNC
uniref:Uncharacterized protein n=1 Tax=Anguilla anguilla TaxID=7936 RepID=A0A0E9SKJ3_ANGAN